jgi:hypothetical protein
LSHGSSPFCSGYFEDGVLRTTFLGCLQTIILLISTSQVARIVGVIHWCPASSYFLSLTILSSLVVAVKHMARVFG